MQILQAAIIAFTSEFIPKLVYYYGYSGNQTLAGYTDFSLSVFKVQYFQSKSIPDDKKIDVFGNVTECRCVWILLQINEGCWEIIETFTLTPLIKDIKINHEISVSFI